MIFAKGFNERGEGEDEYISIFLNKGNFFNNQFKTLSKKVFGFCYTEEVKNESLY